MNDSTVANKQSLACHTENAKKSGKQLEGVFFFFLKHSGRISCDSAKNLGDSIKYETH